MEELGKVFKDKRLKLGISLEEAEEETKISSNYLQAIEDGNFDRVECEVFLKGFLKVYSSYLGLDKQEILKKYEDNSIKESEEEEEEPMKLKEKLSSFADNHQNGLLTAMLFALGAVAVIIFIYFAIFIYDYLVDGASGYSPKVIERVELSIGEMSDKAEAIIEEDIEETNDYGIDLTNDEQKESPNSGEDLSYTGEVFDDTTLEIEIKSIEDSWYLVEIEGEEVFAGISREGEVRDFTGRDIRVRIGNAAGVMIIKDGQEMGPFGAKGEVVSKIFSID
ncbi:helix-turn-helix domain-containing protein [Halonatronum saccharophilum]|uniref:helix-turn-helix domain-containing protein n=1 Tax=Halonatronum saccharophilum TaxID=150060 RepID=UPI000484EA00|nr:helix-turn-helix domain-containing protein [Halonatronum saccharophilum]